MSNKGSESQLLSCLDLDTSYLVRLHEMVVLTKRFKECPPPPPSRANFNCQDFKNALLGIPVEFYCIVIVDVNTLNGNY